MRGIKGGLLVSILIGILLAASGYGADYNESTAGTVQQSIGCDGCGAQILKANYYISEINPVNSGTLDSTRVRISNNYGGSTRCFGIIYGDQASGIGNFLGRSRDSASSSVNTMADRVLHFNSGITLTSGTTYYLGIFTDSTNSTSMRFAVTNSSIARSGITGFDPPHAIVSNYTSAGLAQWENQGLSQIYVTYYYHSGGAVAAPASPILLSPTNSATGQSTSPTLSWSASTGATSYRVQISNSSGFGTLITDLSNITATSLNASGLQNSTVYYWRVLASNSGGSSPFSATQSFTTQPPVTGTMNLLAVSANKRYLLSGGSPTFIDGEAAWSLIAQPNYADANQYLTDRASRGFNAIIVNLIEHRFCDHAPANNAGVSPWTGATFATPNEPYFAHADSVIARAQELGIWVFLAPLYLGSGGGTDGWYSNVVSASTANMASWGTYVGNRYKNYKNVVWVIGGDYDPSAVRAKVDAFTAALKAADNLYPARLVTGHAGLGVGTTYWSESWFDLNNTYTYTLTDIVPLAQTAYDYTPVKPFVFMEGWYENVVISNTPDTVTPAQLRSQAYWSVLRGGCGDFFGNSPIWYFSSTTISDPLGSWKNQLASPGSVSMNYIKNLFTSRNWWTLVPDRSGSVITAGSGSGATLATFAYAADSTTIIGYLPTSRTVTINPSAVRGDSIYVKWYNPATGLSTAVGAFARTARSFTPPASGDWVLVIDGNMVYGNVVAPNPPTLTSPANGATGVSTGPTLSWNASVSATSYRLQVSTDPAFGSTSVDQSNLSATSQGVAGLVSSTVYYWRVSASNGAGTSLYSAVWSFTTAVPSIPAVPTLVSPSNGATGISTSPTLTWNASSGATSYRVQVSTDPAFGTTFLDQSNIEATSLALIGLVAATNYSWRVSASNGSGSSAFSAVWNITTASGTSVGYIGTTAGTVQQAVGCSGCGTQILKANYYISQIDPVNSGSLDSIKVRMSNNYGGAVGCFGVIYGDQATGIGNYLGRSRDSVKSTAPAMADFTLRFNAGITLAAGSRYYVGVISNLSNTTAMRFAVTNNSVNRSGATGFDSPHVVVPNYTSAGLSQYKNQGVKQIYVTYFYHASGVGTQSPIEGPLASISAEPSSEGTPGDFSLQQNYPNPFNPSTRIEFSLPTPCVVTLEVYNLLGQKVRTLVNGELDAGHHSVEWNSHDESGNTVSSGVYFYRLTAGDKLLTKKMLLLK